MLSSWPHQRQEQKPGCSTCFYLSSAVSGGKQAQTRKTVRTMDKLRYGKMDKEVGSEPGLSIVGQELDHDETRQRSVEACTSSSLFPGSRERPWLHISVVSLLIIEKTKGEDRSMNHYCLVWLGHRAVFRNG